MATKMQRVKVLSPFYHRSETVGRDSVLDLPADVAADLRTANKLVFVQADTPLSSNDQPRRPLSEVLKEQAEAKKAEEAEKKPAANLIGKGKEAK